MAALHGPTPVSKHPSPTPLPPSEPFDPTLTPLQVYEQVWDSFYAHSTLSGPISEIENRDMEPSSSAEQEGRLGWDHQICTLYLSELRVDVDEYWSRLAGRRLYSSPDGFHDNDNEHTLSPSEPCSFTSATSESFILGSFTWEESSSPSSSTSIDPQNSTILTPYKILCGDPDPDDSDDPEEKWGPHASYIACTPISDNLVSPSLVLANSGSSFSRPPIPAPKVDFVPFADDERFVIVTEPTLTGNSGSRSRDMGRSGSKATKSRLRTLKDIEKRQRSLKNTEEEVHAWSGDSSMMDVDDRENMSTTQFQTSGSRYRQEDDFDIDELEHELPDRDSDDDEDLVHDHDIEKLEASRDLVQFGLTSEDDDSSSDNEPDHEDSERESNDSPQGYLDLTWETTRSEVVEWTWMRSFTDPDCKSLQYFNFSFASMLSISRY
jgi:hypothetical protein